MSDISQTYQDIKSEDLIRVNLRVNESLRSGQVNEEILDLISKWFFWVGGRQKSVFEFVSSVFFNPTNCKEIRSAAGKTLKIISFSQYFYKNPIIIEDSLTTLLESFEMIDADLAQYALDFISQQILFSNKMYIPFFSANLLSDYFINLADKVDLSNLILALSKYVPPQTELDTIISWCMEVIKNGPVIGNKVLAVKIMGNMKLHESKNDSLTPVQDEIQAFIYQECSSDNVIMRDACFSFLFWSNCPIEPVIDTVFNAVGSGVSEYGLRIIIKYEEELCENAKEEMAALLLHVAKCYPYPFQKAAVGLIFKHHLNVLMDGKVVFEVLLHFLTDDKLVEDIALAIFNYIVNSDWEESYKMIEMLREYEDDIHQLSISSNQKVSECGAFFESITAPIPEE